MSAFTIYTTVWCAACRRLKAQLDRAGIGYCEIDIELDAEAATFVEGANGGNRTVPTVRLPDSSILTNPSFVQITSVLAA